MMKIPDDKILNDIDQYDYLCTAVQKIFSRQFPSKSMLILLNKERDEIIQRMKDRNIQMPKKLS